MVKDKNGNIEPVQKYRDVIKKVAFGAEFIILGTENQMNIHYAMPVRGMLYDALNYTSQVRDTGRRHKEKKDLAGDEFLSLFSKNDKILPAITLVVYYGKKKWDGCIDLHDILTFGEKEELIKPFISNYKMNLLWAYDVDDVEKYQTGLREFFGVLKYDQDGDALSEFIGSHRDRFTNLDEDTFQLISELTDMNTNNMKDRFRNEKGGIDMCKAIEDIKKQGIEQGIEQGESKLAELMRVLKLNGRTEDLMRCIEDKIYREELYKEYKLQ